MSWNLTTDRPIYLQLVEQIERRILSGTYSTGDRFPTVRDLANEASVNPNTMQKALQELERIGLIVTNRTNGRTVSSDATLLASMRNNLARDQFASFKEKMNELGFSEKELLQFIQQELEQ